MPVILDRLPLPNTSWYTGISVFCLLCSVYYAGVQVKLHPDWKEQLQLRQAAAANRDKPPDITPPFDAELDVEFCPKDEKQFPVKFENDVKGFIQELEELCIQERFSGIIQGYLYPHCYLRINSLDENFRLFLLYNANRLSRSMAPLNPDDYFHLCRLKTDRLQEKKNEDPTKNGRTNIRDASNSSDSSEKTSSSNRCSSDSFYDSYDRGINSEVSVYHISDGGHCDEREMSPYLIPEIISFMFHEPLCIWTLINMAYCVLILLGTTIQHMVFGELRVSEQQHIKDKFWNFVFYKFIFVFGVMNVKHMDEAVLWCSWFSVLGFLHLLAQLCKDRFEYLSFSGHTGRRTHIRLLALLGIILLVASACLFISVLVGCHAGINTFAFMAAECILLIVRTIHVITRYSIYLWDISHKGLWEKRGSYVYVTELIFELSELVIDMVHHIHMLVWGNIMLTMASLVICMQLRLLFYQLQHKVKTHRNYLRVRKLMAGYPEVEPSDSITCPICWEDVAKGRRLPCGHVFHTDCLLDWLPQHLSCPTCRHSLKPLPQGLPRSGSLLGTLFTRRSSDPLVADNFHQRNQSATPPHSSPSSLAGSVSGSPTRAMRFNAANSESYQLDGTGGAISGADYQRPAVTVENGERVTRENSSARKPSSVKSGGSSRSDGDRDEDVNFWDREEEGRYVSWLSSFSVEQRHTQLPHQRSETTVPESSLHLMAVQIQQMFPLADYDIIMEDLFRTRSLSVTVDNILENRVPVPCSSPPFRRCQSSKSLESSKIPSNKNETRNSNAFFSKLKKSDDSSRTSSDDEEYSSVSDSDGTDESCAAVNKNESVDKNVPSEKKAVEDAPNSSKIAEKSSETSHTLNSFEKDRREASDGARRRQP